MQFSCMQHLKLLNLKIENRLDGLLAGLIIPPLIVLIILAIMQELPGKKNLKLKKKYLKKSK